MPRIITYNVHRCVGTDRRLDVGRVAEVIAALKPDIVALQELDVGRARTGGVDQAHEIARRLGMAFHFHAALKVEEELYGDAILTMRPERLVRTGPLPGYRPVPKLEPRGALWLAIEIDGREVQVITSHLGLVPREQQLQAEALAGAEWLGHADCRDPVILLGDFNATASSVVHRTLTRRLKPARALAPRPSSTATFPSRLPVLRIDHIFVSPGIQVEDMTAPFLPLTRVASDHLPLVMDFHLE
ncbi:endonuclease/exonuclease/phosphatase family protein [Phenylobacterium aquaticum]|uniref:endonuclease/exonuclease/phosphatase family protein n=1 Tax=Phenylobacterium aquaticum TaxID=1763816 RepID=UPI0026F3134B|nr:endonuclease/exonuclease/phosphatase family protein [Phenylobacterium aquaticum]